MKTVKILVSGRVQGVFFRVYTQKYARELIGVSGIVRNLRDGRVEIIAEGDESELQKLVEWSKKGGSPGSVIRSTEVMWKEKSSREYTDFQIGYGY
ncbi:MAG: acylphosphatase [Candidatus Hodarchaeales archaeon]|jgi:acylphosphatase